MTLVRNQSALTISARTFPVFKGEGKDQNIYCYYADVHSVATSAGNLLPPPDALRENSDLVKGLPFGLGVGEVSGAYKLLICQDDAINWLFHNGAAITVLDSLRRSGVPFQLFGAHQTLHIGNNISTISILTEIPEYLHNRLQDFLTLNKAMSQDDVIGEALARFLGGDREQKVNEL